MSETSPNVRVHPSTFQEVLLVGLNGTNADLLRKSSTERLPANTPLEGWVKERAAGDPTIYCIGSLAIVKGFVSINNQRTRVSSEPEGFRRTFVDATLLPTRDPELLLAVAQERLGDQQPKWRPHLEVLLESTVAFAETGNFDKPPDFEPTIIIARNGFPVSYEPETDVFIEMSD